MSKIKDILTCLPHDKRSQIMLAFNQGVEHVIEYDGYILGVNLYNKDRFSTKVLIEEVNTFTLYREAQDEVDVVKEVDDSSVSDSVSSDVTFPINRL